MASRSVVDISPLFRRASWDDSRGTITISVPKAMKKLFRKICVFVGGRGDKITWKKIKRSYFFITLHTKWKPLKQVFIFRSNVRVWAELYGGPRTHLTPLIYVIILFYMWVQYPVMVKNLIKLLTGSQFYSLLVG